MARICFPYDANRKQEIKQAIWDWFLEITKNKTDYSLLDQEVAKLGIVTGSFKGWIMGTSKRSPSLENLLKLWEITGNDRFIFKYDEYQYAKKRGLQMPDNYPKIKKAKIKEIKWSSESMYSKQRKDDIGEQIDIWIHTLPRPMSIKSVELIGVSYNTIRFWIDGSFGPKAELMYKLYLLTKDDDRIQSDVFIMSPDELKIAERRKTGVPEEMRVLTQQKFGRKPETKNIEIEKPEVQETLPEVQPARQNIEQVLRTLNLMLISNLSSFKAFKQFVEMFDIDSEKFDDNQQAKAVDLVKTLIEIFGLKVEDFISDLVDDETESSSVVVQILQALSQQTTRGGE